MSHAITRINLEDRTKPNKPVKKGQILHGSNAYEISKGVEIRETERRKVVMRGWGPGEKRRLNV